MAYADQRGVLQEGGRKSMAATKRRLAWLLGLSFITPLALGGCELKCETDESKLERVIDKVGDQAEKVADKLADD